MKQRLLFFAFPLLLSVNSFAVKHNVNVADFSFSPATLNMSLGDTIMWTWQSGSHTTTSSSGSIPPGAATWDNPLSASSTSFMYVPTVAGMYGYVCTPHAGMGMAGSFTVNFPVNINNINKDFSFVLYPNPAASVLHLNFDATPHHVDIKITDMSGRLVYSTAFENAATAEINLELLTNGVYMLMAEADGKRSVKTISVLH